MISPAFLVPATIVVALIIVLALVYYLVSIIVALRRAGNHLAALAGGLQAIVDHSAPLEPHLTTINGALGTLEEGLDAVDEDLVAAAQVMNLV